MTYIEAGWIDCVVVYKVDRLSRSLLDFCAAYGQIRQAPDRIRLGHAAVQYDQLNGPADAQRALVVRPVRTRESPPRPFQVSFGIQRKYTLLDTCARSFSLPV